jgi:formylmethanofuran dehydrogenase subunit E
MTSKISGLGRAAAAGGVSLAILAAPHLRADDRHDGPATPRAQTGRTNAIFIQSQPGGNAWNAGRPPGDWWAEIQRQHGHVGPWNVLGWRIAQAALRDLKAEWGRHELEIVCYVPPQTPFTCLVDGLAVGSGNSLGRLDLRLAEVMDYRQSFVSIRRKDGKGDLLEFRPHAGYLKSITNQPVEALERLSRECSERGEHEMFAVRRLAAPVRAGD